MYEYANNTDDHFAIIAHHPVNLLIEIHKYFYTLQWRYCNYFF